MVDTDVHENTVQKSMALYFLTIQRGGKWKEEIEIWWIRPDTKQIREKKEDVPRQWDEKMQHGLVVTKQPSTRCLQPSPQKSFPALCSALFMTLLEDQQPGCHCNPVKWSYCLMKDPKEMVAAWESGSACLFMCKMGMTHMNVDVSVVNLLLSLPLCPASAM